jgi:hypothetical protein
MHIAYMFILLDQIRVTAMNGLISMTFYLIRIVQSLHSNHLHRPSIALILYQSL